MVSIRQKKIIECLCQTSEYTSIKKLAETIELTERTVYRELPDIKKLLSKYNIKMITVFNKGIKVDTSLKKLSQLKRFLNSNILHEIYPASKRNDIILLRLLDEKSYIKAQVLAIDTKSSLKTVRNDLDRLKKLAPKYRIMIESKKGSGFFIKADELLKQNLLVKIILSNLKVEDFFKYLSTENILPIMAHYIFYKLNYKDYFNRIYNLLQPMIVSYNIQITDRNFQEMILMLAVLLKHNGLGTDNYSFNNDLLMPYAEQDFMTKLKEEIENEFLCNFGKNETEYFWGIISLYININYDGEIGYNKDLLKCIISLINKAEQKLHQKLYNLTLEKNLYNHLSMALNRMKKGIRINNPYKNDIKKNYGNIYTVIYKICKEIFTDENISDDEIAYITLYFVVAMDDVNNRIFKALVVCTSGMGTSKLLVSRLKKELPNIVVEKTLPFIKLKEDELDRYDIIILTAPLHIQMNKSITVSPLLTDKEVKELRQILEK
ncbi:BglG family transcription antiterminator [Pectinatus frisingensis]|uniref:BglG family transcription antiterminator n=1 Tax=Pectinatus frisingensis TaxID=865 RepID=UPI0018C73D61|nr:PRD domain-containing protein [Pectinatus frisingensis]